MRPGALAACLALALAAPALAGGGAGEEGEGDLPPKVRRIPDAGTFPYAVCVSQETYADAGWKAAADALVERRKGALILYPSGDPASARETLASVAPRHAAFVARPEEAGRAFVLAVHRMTRRLDDDPYADCLWGIVTGYEAADALRIAKEPGPLRIGRLASGMGVGPDDFLLKEGSAYSECRQAACLTRAAGQKPVEGKCPADATEELARMFSGAPPQAIFTSGHAKEREWHVGYSFKGGTFRSVDGLVFGEDLNKAGHPVKSAGPNVYIACGNCLIGHVTGRDAMVPAWIHSGGIRQMVGYTVVTWYGYVGWGTKDYWLSSGGKLTLAEAFFAATQACAFELETRYPAAARLEMPEPVLASEGRLLNAFATERRMPDKDSVGLLWDRDVVAFYGDPAWEARADLADPSPYDVSAEQKEIPGGRLRVTLTVRANRDLSIPKPVFALLPTPVSDPVFPKGETAAAPGEFVLWKVPGELKKGETRTLTFEAGR